jgi:ribonuclease HIII
MGYDEATIRSHDYEHNFYKNALVMKPMFMIKLIKLMNIAMDISMLDTIVSDKFEQNSNYGMEAKDSAQEIFKKPYYEYHPFIFERLPIFFLNELKAKICIGNNSPCPHNFF